MTPDLTVVKLGGSTFGDHRPVLAEIAGLWQQGHRFVVVHGGGRAVTEWSAALGIEARFSAGLRVTDERTLEVVLAVIGGLLNAQVVAELQRLGVPAAGLTGCDGGLLRARAGDRSLGFVGDVSGCDPAIISVLLAAGLLPVVATAALGEAGEPALLNVNGDTAAGAIARALRAARLVFLSDIPGVLAADGAVIPRLDPPGIEAGVGAGTFSGGMIPKLRNAAAVLDGVGAVHICDGRSAGSLSAILGGSIPGTLIEGTAA